MNLSALLICCLLSGDFRYARHYVKGEVTRYELRSFYQDQPEKADSAIVELRSAKLGKYRGETVHWIRYLTPQGMERPTAIPPYSISLDRRAPAAPLPRVSDPALLGFVGDLHTFLLLLRPEGGIDRLRRVRDAFESPEPLTGDWSGGDTTLVGQDRLILSSRLTALDRETFSIGATFSQPWRGPRLRMHAPFMEDSVCSLPNNFQMIRRQGAGFVVIWGCESFSVSLTAERRSGRIRKARMENTLGWKLRFCRDKQLQSCQPLPDTNRVRVVELHQVFP